jgi:hypothetical protein
MFLDLGYPYSVVCPFLLNINSFPHESSCIGMFPCSSPSRCFSLGLFFSTTPSCISLDGGTLFSAWSLNVYVTFLASVLYSGWMRAGPTCPGTRGRGRVCVPSDAGRSPRGVGDAPCAGLAPPGSVLPARIPLREAAPCRGWELGVDGGGGVAEWAKAAPALEAPDYRRSRRDPRWAVSIPE